MTHESHDECFNVPASVMFSGSFNVTADSKLPQNGPSANMVDNIPVTQRT